MAVEDTRWEMTENAARSLISSRAFTLLAPTDQAAVSAAIQAAVGLSSNRRMEFGWAFVEIAAEHMACSEMLVCGVFTMSEPLYDSEIEYFPFGTHYVFELTGQQDRPLPSALELEFWRWTAVVHAEGSRDTRDAN